MTKEGEYWLSGADMCTMLEFFYNSGGFCETTFTMYLLL